MATKGIGAVLVMDGARLAGILSERDYARKVVLQGRSSKDTPVRDIMTADVITVAGPATVPSTACRW
jgi:CBS domain-containing protein